MAAVLACGADAVLSHKSAAALWNLPVGGGAAAVDVTVPGRSRRGQKGINLHRVRRLDRADRTVIDNIPVTTWPRTLLDEAEALSRERLRSMVEASERLDLFDFSLIEETIARNPGRRGIKPLRAVARQLKGPAPDTRSGKERTFLELVRAAGLPEPSVNAVVLGDVADYYWPAEGLVVEIDSYKYHRSRRKFEEDRARDTKRQLAGLACLRVTETRIAGEPHGVVRDVRTMLRRRPAS
jgi:very-short-patch-repair endonuclease